MLRFVYALLDLHVCIRVGAVREGVHAYNQALAALNAQDPTIAAVFNSSPEAQSGLRQFLAGSPSQRKQMAHEMVSDPDSQPYIGVLQQTFATCNNY